MTPRAFTTPCTARYLSMGKPGSTIVCLHYHDQPVTDLADQLRNLDTPERVLLPETLSRYELPSTAD
ncbi:hypothetical protein [Hymenobacter terrenus]|uniref:hypothetical protein n=1 Tax=Hymenobacter terrenus TaxID=1629124 RepID=UPI000619643D|nr:hypothetical protein [Hymenobacter terrenus]